MLIPILVTFASIIIVFVVIVATRPAEFEIVRSATISASPATVFEHVNHLRKWEAWSPWAKRDPQMRQQYEGPAAGVGAVHAWQGNKNVGEGRMTITESKPAERITIRLEFIKPFAATNTTVFTFVEQGGQTVVRWSMTGRNNFMGKLFGLLMNMDKMVGGDFEKGLASMKAVAEAAK